MWTMCGGIGGVSLVWLTHYMLFSPPSVSIQVTCKEAVDFAVRPNHRVQNLDGIEVYEHGTEKLIWEILSNDSSAHGLNIRFGIVPKSWSQRFPTGEAAPAPLIAGKKYVVCANFRYNHFFAFSAGSDCVVFEDK